MDFWSCLINLVQVETDGNNGFVSVSVFALWLVTMTDTSLFAQTGVTWTNCGNELIQYTQINTVGNFAAMLSACRSLGNGAKMASPSTARQNECVHRQRKSAANFHWIGLKANPHVFYADSRQNFDEIIGSGRMTAPPFASNISSAWPSWRANVTGSSEACLVAFSTLDGAQTAGWYPENCSMLLPVICERPLPGEILGHIYSVQSAVNSFESFFSPLERQLHFRIIYAGSCRDGFFFFFFLLELNGEDLRSTFCERKGSNRWLKAAIQSWVTGTRPERTYVFLDAEWFRILCMHQAYTVRSPLKWFKRIMSTLILVTWLCLIVRLHRVWNSRWHVPLVIRQLVCISVRFLTCDLHNEFLLWLPNGASAPYAPINCKPPPPPPPPETMGDLTASLCPGWGIWPQGGLRGWGTLTDASLHCDLRVYRVGLFDHFVCPRLGDLGYIWPHPTQIPTISRGGGGYPGACNW